MSDNFKKAAVMKLRFPSLQGSLTTEDLFTLPITTVNPNKASLSDLAKALFKELKEADEPDFITESKVVNRAREIVQLKYDLVREVVEDKKVKQETEAQARAIRERNQVLLGVVAQKENQQLLDMPLEELKKLIKEQE